MVNYDDRVHRTRTALRQDGIHHFGFFLLLSLNVGCASIEIAGRWAQRKSAGDSQSVRENQR